MRQPDEEIARHAKMLLSNPALNFVLDGLHRDTVEALLATALPDKATRDILFHQAKGIEQIKPALQRLADLL